MKKQISPQEIKVYKDKLEALKNARNSLSTIISPYNLGEIWHCLTLEGAGALDVAIQRLEKDINKGIIKMEDEN